DAQGKILYIGKANSLKNRVQSYFTRPLDAKTQALVSKIARVEYRKTQTPAHAQILEASLVKKYLPRYNIDLKDDKSFPWIKITRENYPIVSISRRRGSGKAPDALYFGPYTDAKMLRQAFKELRRVFGFRTCAKLPKSTCLYYRLKLCPAPCAGKVKAGEYRKIISQVKLFLESKYAELLKEMSYSMQAAASEKRFEEAAQIRDRIQALGSLQQAGSGFNSPSELLGLKNLLGLKKIPLRIEAFDISNIRGQEPAGSMVSFYNGFSDKDNYRRFRIKGVCGINDYDMLREVIRRRYSRLVKENLTFPDLVLIDGGRGHLMAAYGVIKELRLELPLASIAKAKENIYTRNRQFPLKLKEGSPALNLIRRVRDEAHRFALKYHHLLHKKKVIGE
ncbi:MAG: UvrB/UvrC motif-containing protein, partial [Candidatus Omnitrophota bacterium]